MNKEARYFLYFILLMTLVVIFYRYQQYVIKEKFILKVNTACNSINESCFVADCSSEDDTECDVVPYKKVDILNAYAPKCLQEHSCSEFSCESSESECSITYCSSDTVEFGEKCSEFIEN